MQQLASINQTKLQQSS